PATRYTWRVQVADAHGQWSAWSKPAWFETAFRGWTGSWIGRPGGDAGPPSLEGANWIWYPEGDPATSAPAGTRYFRTEFDVPAVPQGARLVMTADDGFTAWVNGAEAGGREPDPNQENWRRPITVEVPLRQGRNVIAVAATNGRVSPAGLLGRIEGVTVTDGAWKATDAEPTGDWKAAGFDDSAWQQAKVLAAWGSGPWGRVTAERPTLPEPLLRRTFAVDKPVRQARLYAAAAGYVELTLNGRRVGDQVLQPGFTRYDKRVQFVTYDVTRMLRGGGNTLGARLGRGFYGMTQQNVWNWHAAPWTAEPRLLGQLVVTYADGTTRSVATDGQWEFADGPTTYDSLYGGETYDARLDKPAGWQPAAVLKAPTTTVVPQEQEPIKVTATLDPVERTTPKPGVTVYKLPRNIAGWARITAHGAPGDRVTLVYGERLEPDGTLAPSNGNVTGRFQRDEYVLRGGDTETWEPRYSYKGFQYVQVTGPVDTLQGREVHSELRSTGEFSSSEPMFGQIRAATRQTVENNWHGIPTDTPMYEKNGWTGDAQLMAEMQANEFDLRRLLAKWMTDHRDSQGADGLVPAIVPDNGWGLTPGWQAPPWHASLTVIPWMAYQRYGDRDLLAATYPAMRAYLDGWLPRGAGGLYSSTLNDYLAPGYGGNTPEDMRLAGTAFTYLNARLTADAAEVLGHADDAARYRAAMATMKDAFNAAFLRGDAYVTATDPGYRQTSALLALALGLAPAGQEQAITDRLVRDITERGDHLNTGALGTKYLLTELTRRGQGELAYRIATRRTYPSWGYWLDNGATTLWERWDTGARSRDHVFLGGAIGEWFFEDLAGITPAAPGFDRIRVAPQFLGDLTNVQAATQTPHGRVAVRWSRTGQSYRVSVDVPVGATATVVLPDGRQPEAGSGTHEFKGEIR
ncbi:MAG: family 78 glycoside hydrolase catalytic domain, partial [Nonomuraea sp.]|nr:family 78 glycoside hydrolase catalytic domain [Nonomuraea sp.]